MAEDFKSTKQLIGLLNGSVGLDYVLKNMNTSSIENFIKDPNDLETRTAIYLECGTLDKAGHMVEGKKLKRKPIEKYAEKIDPYKFLTNIILVLVLKHGEKIDEFTPVELRKLKGAVDLGKKFLKGRKISLSNEPDTLLTCDAIIKQANGILKSYFHGVYINPREMDQLDSLYNGTTLDETHIPLIEKLGFQLGDFLRLYKAQENGILKILLDNKVMDINDAKRVAYRQTSFTDTKFKEVYDLSLFTKEDILEKYLVGKISLDNFRSLKSTSKNKKEIEEILDPSQLAACYILKNEDDFSESIYRKVRDLYKVLRLEGKSESEKDKASEELLGTNKRLLNKDSLHELYVDGIISCDIYLSHAGISPIEALREGVLKPKDIKILFYKGIITEDTIEEFFKDPVIPYEDKIVFIAETFNGTEDKSLPEDDVRRIDGRLDEDMHNKFEVYLVEATIKKSIPYKRLRFIESLDPDFIPVSMGGEDAGIGKKVSKNGYIVGKLPNKELYIVERLFDRSEESSIEPSFGRPTYFIPEDIMKLYKDEIFKKDEDGDITLDELKMNQLYNNPRVKGVIKKIHTRSWENDLRNELGMDTKYDKDSYTKEEYMIISKAKLGVEVSRMRIQDDKDK